MGFKENGGIQIYSVVRWMCLQLAYIALANPHFFSFALIQLPRPRCVTCAKQGQGLEYSFRLHVCMQCVFMGCWGTNQSKTNHLKQHFADTGHILGTCPLPTSPFLPHLLPSPSSYRILSPSSPSYSPPILPAVSHMHFL